MRALDQSYFEELKKTALSLLQKSEHLFITLDAESSQFLRINAGKVRQTGLVSDAQMSLSFVSEDNKCLKRASRSQTLSGEIKSDQATVKKLVEGLRLEVQSLPEDTFAEIPKAHPSSRTERKGNLLSPFEAADTLLSPLKNVDLVGHYASGPIVRAFANSAGLSHWFKTDSYLFDYSLYTPDQKAIKGLISGQSWDSEKYESKILEDASRLKLLNKNSKKLSPGEYRVYLAPSAVYDLISMLSWGGVSEASIQQGDSPFRKLRSNERTFSPLFSLSEDFCGGEVPRWNEEGELAPTSLSIVESGKLKNSLISTRTAREYKLVANGATGSEGLRSPSMAAGTLTEAAALATLETGIYLSNLHYLNWSDQPEGRITGMTRYACFWVQNGEIQSPIDNMRFDDTIFRIFGSELIGVGKEATWIPDVSTYGMRSLGSAKIPGIVANMKFTL